MKIISVPQSWFRTGAEQLEDRDSWGQFPAGGSLHVDDGVSRLVDDHLGLVAQARLNELEVRRRSVGILKYNQIFY